MDREAEKDKLARAMERKGWSVQQVRLTKDQGGSETKPRSFDPARERLSSGHAAFAEPTLMAH